MRRVLIVVATVALFFLFPLVALGTSFEHDLQLPAVASGRQAAPAPLGPAQEEEETPVPPLTDLADPVTTTLGPTPTLDPAVPLSSTTVGELPLRVDPTVAPIPRMHVVAEGESLFYIAQFYSTTVEALQIANNLTDPSLLYVGASLVVPGGEGSEVPALYTVQVGDTPAGVAAKYNTTVDALALVNHFVLPRQLPAGQQLSLMSRTGSALPQTVTGSPYIVQPGDSLLKIALATGTSLQEIRTLNQLGEDGDLYRLTPLYVGQRLRLPSEQIFRDLPHEWVTVELNRLPLRPGSSFSIYVENLQPGRATGVLTGPDGITLPLRFVPDSARPGHSAMVGIDAFAPIGEYRLSLAGEGDFRPWLPFEQPILIGASDYGFQQITISPELANLLAPEVRAEEDAFLNTIFSSSNPEPYWDGPFVLPITNSVTAGYGASRSYNGGPYNIFHTGIDFSGTIGTPIAAPAVGTVVYSDTLNLRGNVLIVDHGMGVMTAYYHLSKVDVAVGDVVQPGQKIAEGGNTGLSTGPHLHWDLRVWGAAVDPSPWLEWTFP